MVGGMLGLLKVLGGIMDKVAVSAKGTIGILGDDIAVSANSLGGLSASREKPVIKAISKWATLNRFIVLIIIFSLVACLASEYLPKVLIPILLVGGVYLCFEAGEKICEYFSEYFFGKHDEAEVVMNEKEKIKSAAITDFVLTIEIVVIALNTVMGIPLLHQIIVVSAVAFGTIPLVYGLLFLIVRMDDRGISLLESAGEKTSFLANSKRFVGKALIKGLPIIVHFLEHLGTLAMFLVGGGIFRHNIDAIHHATDFMYSIIADLAVGLLVGVVAVLTMMVIKAVVKLVKK